jgi:fatty-acyl-CoA synthase
MGNVEPMPLAQSREGGLMAYSSGTSGRPKGILRPLDDRAFGEPIPFEMLMRDRYGIGEDSIYLTPAPLYHTAPIGWTMGAQALGATTAVMEQFDAEATLRAIETHRVTHAQFVPTHFVRMLKLPEAVRGRYDLSSLRVVLHSAAPCPPDVKDAMIDWLGPIIEEYYGGSEGGGFFTIGSEEWRRHRGSVGRPLPGLSHETRAGVHIVDPESGALLPVGEIGVIYFEGVARFDYHKAPEQTAQFFNAKGWGTLGDMGWLDDEGYLHLADRLSQMIISGGVNIYPQEIEAALALHPAVLDVAVIGVPNEEFGEEVKALVQPVGTADEKLRAELADYCRERLAGFKCPRSIDFVTELPRLANGKLLKRKLREPFWPNAQGRI